MSSDQDYVDAIARNREADADADHESECAYAITVFPDGVLLTAWGGVHEGRMEDILADYDESGGASTMRESVYCMLLRTEQPKDAVGEIIDTLIENHIEDHHIHEEDLSHDYDSIDEYIADTRPANNGSVDEIADDDEQSWDDDEEDEDRDLDDEEDNYWLGIDG